ncbi:MAG: hypothetical protein LBC68_04635 [Prevotellaceae bacterium]|jgi:hypothetical protein|nr:hypothetical protein [Prevotellaceae bacterium]
MFVKSKIGIIIFKAGGFALLWVLIVTCTMFPEVLGSGIRFLSERYIFGNVGRVLLFTLGIYTFDLMIQILYAIDEHLSKKFIAQILGCITVCILSVSLTIDTGLQNIGPFLFVGISMGYMKALTLYVSDTTKKVDNLESEIKIGDL